MKRTILVVLALALAASVLAAAPIKLKLSEIHQDGYPTTLADREFARLVKEKTEGRIEITVYPNGVLNATEAEGIEALVLGELGFARVSAAPVASFVPDLDAIQLPYLYKNADHMWAVLNGQIGQDMLAKIQSSGSGLIGLCWYDAGSRCYYLTKKVSTPKEMAGLKIRMQDNKMMVKMTELLGGVSVTGIGSNEIYGSIMSGVIDGAENNWPTYDTKGDYKAAKYYILDHHTRVPEILLMSEASMRQRKVSAADIAIIKQCAKATQEYEIAQWKEMEKKSEANVRAGGTVVVSLTPAEMKLFQDAMKPLYADPAYAKYSSIINAIAEVGKKF